MKQPTRLQYQLDIVTSHSYFYQGSTQHGGGGAGATAPLEKTIFTIFRMSLLIILWIYIWGFFVT